MHKLEGFSSFYLIRKWEKLIFLVRKHLQPEFRRHQQMHQEDVTSRR